MTSRGVKEDTTLPGASLMTDGYLGGISLVTNHQIPSNLFGGPEKVAFATKDDQAEGECDETEVQTFRKSGNTTARLSEYNRLYNGLMIIPWDEFAANPTNLNDLFHREKTGFITFDSEEVNVFFHATRMNKPVLGDISENGKSWVITVETVRELENIRTALIEKISVFGLTLMKKEKRFGKPKRAPCLLTLDPHHGTIGEQIHTNIMKCINIMEERKNFCLEINFNGSVERWCRRITMTDSRSVGARLIITNGEEADSIATAENIVCCIVCFPIWAIQTGIYKAHRAATYQDIDLTFAAEEVILYGSIGSIQNQRLKLFKEDNEGNVFYTSPSDAPPNDQGHKYICVKKYDKNRDDENDVTAKIVQHPTTNVQELFSHKQDKILKTLGKHGSSVGKSNNSAKTTTEQKMKFELRASSKFGTPYSYNNQIRTRQDSVQSSKSIDEETYPKALEALSKGRTNEPVKPVVKAEESDSETISPDEKEDDEGNINTQVVELTPKKVDNKLVLEENFNETEMKTSNTLHGTGVMNNKSSRQNYEKGKQNLAFESDDDIDTESKVEVPKGRGVTVSRTTSSVDKPFGSEFLRNGGSYVNGHEKGIRDENAQQSSKQTNDLNAMKTDGKLPSLPPAGGKLPPLNVGTTKQQVDQSENSLFETNLKFKHRRQLSQGMVDQNVIDDIVAASEQNIIAVNKTDQTYEVDTTDVDKTDVETDLDLSDLESDDDLTQSDANPFARANSSTAQSGISKIRPSSSKRRKPAYDSRRRYLAVQFPKKNVTCSRPDPQNNSLLKTL